MRSLVIEIYENAQPAATIRIPLLVLRVAEKLIPKRVTSTLAGGDIDFKALIEAASQEEMTGQLLEVVDHKDNERVVISVL